MTIRLSKSKLMSARQCLKRLYLEIYRPELEAPSAARESAFDTGRRVGEMARRLYATDEAEFIQYEGDLSHALEKTARLVSAGPKYPIFEATFQYDGVLIRVDALMPADAGWRIVEVKAATSVKEEYAFDCAVQSWVFQGLKHRLDGVSLAHVDGSFVYAGGGDYRGFLIEADMADEVAQLQPIVPEWVLEAREVVAGDEPDIPVGAHCFNPYECPFISHCWPSDADYPLLGLAGSKTTLAEFAREGYRDIRDVPGTRLSDKQRRIRRVTASGRPELLPAASRFVAGLSYPRYYLDFETVMPSVPLWAGTRPYETLPFQWSCHYEGERDKIDHAEFIDLTGDPPMRRFAESLIRALGREGPILHYTPYETQIIVGLIQRFPDLDSSMQGLLNRLVDLAPLTRDNYYHPDMQGSWSLKSVMPTIDDRFSYEKLLGIQEGIAASEAYFEAIDPATAAPRRAEIRAQLLEYCKFDTAALVRLVQFLGQ